MWCGSFILDLFKAFDFLVCELAIFADFLCTHKSIMTSKMTTTTTTTDSKECSFNLELQRNRIEITKHKHTICL